MNIERPDLSQVSPKVRAYIEALEKALDISSSTRSEPMPEEVPTTCNIITISASGMAKRTPRHLYNRQRRGGMGIFDLDTSDQDPPAHLVVADESQDLLLFTSLGRAFYLPVNKLDAAPVRSPGQSLTSLDGEEGPLLPLQPDERLELAIAAQNQAYLALLSRQGHVRILARAYLRPGTPLYDTQAAGPPVSACWTTGRGELFIATRQGQAIRFPERALPVSGGTGITLKAKDTAVSILAVDAESGVFLQSADGLGAIRLMSGFNPNKSPGGSGKIALRTDHLVGAVCVQESDDLFVISRLSKIIRFQAAEVPAKTGVVQGVRCMSLRADQTVAVVNAPLS